MGLSGREHPKLLPKPPRKSDERRNAEASEFVFPGNFPAKSKGPAMSASGIDAFDKTLQTTHIWLNEIMEDIGPDRQVAWKVLSTVLHKLRDRLHLGLAAHLGSQLPLLIRGVYYDQFEPAKLPSECATREQFVTEVAEWLSDTRPVDPDLAVRSVFGVLARHVSPGQIDKVCQALPKPLRQWFEAIRDDAAQGGSRSMNADAGAGGDASAFFGGEPGEAERSGQPARQPEPRS